MIISFKLYDNSAEILLDTNYPAKLAIEIAGHKKKTPELVTRFLNEVQPDPKRFSDSKNWPIDTRNAVLMTLYAHRNKNKLIDTISFECPVCGEKHSTKHSWKDTLETEKTIEGKAERIVDNYTIKPLTGEHESELYDILESIQYLSDSLITLTNNYTRDNREDLKEIRKTADEISKLKLEYRLYKVASAAGVSVDALSFDGFDMLEESVISALDDMKHGFNYTIGYKCGGEVCRVNLPFPSNFALPEL